MAEAARFLTQVPHKGLAGKASYPLPGGQALVALFENKFRPRSATFPADSAGTYDKLECRGGQELPKIADLLR